MTDQRGSIVWFRQDLRLEDNRALLAGVGHRGPVIPVFIWAPEEEGRWPPGAASRWWLHQSLLDLEASLGRIGSRLIVRRGPTLAALRDLAKETGASAVFWNRRYEPAIIERDSQAKEALRRKGLAVESFNASLLLEPWSVKTQEGQPYRVFTPFWRASQLQLGPLTSVPAPSQLEWPKRWPESLAVKDLCLEPTIDWAGGLRANWQPGETGARKQLDRFLDGAIACYVDHRDRPDLAGTSRLSPHLHFGEISVREIWSKLSDTSLDDESSRVYRNELGWREFAYHLLFHFPHTAEHPLRAEFASFPWETNRRHLRAWQRGRTGYPIVDAGMRELWHTGWMHNRVRMIVASFLVKDLLISWQEGARWFWDTLVDADLANNTLGWQWTAGCGADAAPYFRVFNPVSQGEKFDPAGDYARRWISALSQIPTKYVHKPWGVPADVSSKAGTAYRNYPQPIVDHQQARLLALDKFRQIK